MSDSLYIFKTDQNNDAIITFLTKSFFILVYLFWYLESLLYILPWTQTRLFMHLSKMNGAVAEEIQALFC